jgi:hypothetical protein
VTVIAGHSATFSVQAGGNPAPSYQWKKDGSVIPGATSGTLTLNSVQAERAGIYTVQLTNSVGSIASSGAVLSVQTPPVITTQPASVTISEGGSAKLIVQATGNPSPSYQWRLNGQAIAGATSSSLALTSVSRSRAGTYSVVVTNSAGSVTSGNANLNVQFPPEIITDLNSSIAYTGNRVDFTVGVIGNPQPSITWVKDGRIVQRGSQSILTMSGVSKVNKGVYQIIVTNALGTRRGRLATLSVRSTQDSGGGEPDTLPVNAYLHSAGVNHRFPGDDTIQDPLNGSGTTGNDQ